MKLNMNILIVVVILMINSCNLDEEPMSSGTEVLYTFPEESEPHEGTWLQWPHHYQYGVEFREDLDPTWIELVAITSLP